jgi:hypothetical protein
MSFKIFFLFFFIFFCFRKWKKTSFLKMSFLNFFFVANRLPPLPSTLTKFKPNPSSHLGGDREVSPDRQDLVVCSRPLFRFPTQILAFGSNLDNHELFSFFLCFLWFLRFLCIGLLFYHTSYMHLNAADGLLHIQSAYCAAFADKPWSKSSTPLQKQQSVTALVKCNC